MTDEMIDTGWVDIHGQPIFRPRNPMPRIINQNQNTPSYQVLSAAIEQDEAARSETGLSVQQQVAARLQERSNP